MPAEYLEIPLDKEEREKLLKIIGFPKGWTSFKKWLAINKYKITEKRVDNKRYQIISLGNNVPIFTPPSFITGGGNFWQFGIGIKKMGYFSAKK